MGCKKFRCNLEVSIKMADFLNHLTLSHQLKLSQENLAWIKGSITVVTVWASVDWIRCYPLKIPCYKRFPTKIRSAYLPNFSDILLRSYCFRSIDLFVVSCIECFSFSTSLKFFFMKLWAILSCLSSILEMRLHHF